MAPGGQALATPGPEGPRSSAPCRRTPRAQLQAGPTIYADGLVGFREGRFVGWCASFAGALERAARLSVELATDVARLETEWSERAGRPRRDSATAKILPVLPAQPITPAAIVRGASGVRHQRALEGL